MRVKFANSLYSLQNEHQSVDSIIKMLLGDAIQEDQDYRINYLAEVVARIVDALPCLDAVKLSIIDPHNKFELL